MWSAGLYLESSDNLGVNFKGKAAIDLLGGFYGYNDLRWVVTIDELKRVEKELNTTDEERANAQQEGFRKTFPEADSFEGMDFNLAQDYNKELASSDFGDVGVDAAAAAKDRDGALMGWVVNAHSKDSYMGNVAVSVAFESSGTIRGLEFLELEDTPGLGMKAREDVFKEQLEGQRGFDRNGFRESRGFGDRRHQRGNHHVQCGYKRSQCGNVLCTSLHRRNTVNRWESNIPPCI